MATVTEDFESRTGGTMGVSGARGVFTRWIVETDRAIQDPADVLRSGPERKTYIGHPYPWGGFGVVVLDYAPVERLTEQIWRMDCLYGPPYLIENPEEGLWNWETSTGLIVEHEFFSRNETTGVFDVEIGTPTYALRDELPTPIPPGPLYTVQTRRGNVELSQTFGSRLIGMPRKRPVGVLRLDRVFSYVAPRLMAGIEEAAGTTNSEEFYGAYPDTLMFMGAQMRNRSGGYLPGQPIEGRVTEVVLHFERDVRGIQPVRLTHNYIDSDGERPVRDSRGRLVRDRHTLYKRHDFQTRILDLFDADIVDPVPIGIVNP
jgi:hypothetical protein